MRRSVSSRRDYTKTLELNPEYTDVYINRGVAYSERKEYDRAIADYTKAIELDVKTRQPTTIALTPTFWRAKLPKHCGRSGNPLNCTPIIPEPSTPEEAFLKRWAGARKPS